MVAMFPVAVEQMHQRAGEQQEVRQPAEQVGAVLGEKEKDGHRQEPDENPPEAGRVPLFVCRGAGTHGILTLDRPLRR